MRTDFDFHFPQTRYGAMLILCGTLAAAGTALAQEKHDHAKDQAAAKELMGGHDHGNAGQKNAQFQSQSVSPVKEVKLPEGLSSAQSMAIDQSGRIWFTEKVGKKLAVYDPEKKEFATYSLPASWGKTGFANMTLAPDGEIWFTVTRWVEGVKQPDLLGRFTPADGYFTKYVLPHGVIPEELIVDAKGTIWFLASNKNSLYRVDTKSFALKGYPIPTANGNPKSLTTDQKGHIWFAESTANKIGEFIPEQQVFHEHELLTQFANPGRITVDKQGRVWFVEMTANRLGMYSPELRRFNEALIPTPSSSPVALASDENGNIWFLEYKGNKVGVFNPETAAFHEYDIPSFGSLPADMVIDRKRSLLWFTQSATEAKQLGLISINEALAESNRPGKAQLTQPDEKTGQVSMVKWVALLAAIIALATMGARIFVKSRANKKS